MGHRNIGPMSAEARVEVKNDIAKLQLNCFPAFTSNGRRLPSAARSRSTGGLLGRARCRRELSTMSHRPHLDREPISQWHDRRVEKKLLHKPGNGGIHFLWIMFGGLG